MTSRYQLERRLKRFWREEGNPRLKGLMLAALPNTGIDPQDVGEAWITSQDERSRQLEHNDSPRALQAPVSQQYSPGVHFDTAEGVRQRPESAAARTLAKDEFGDDDYEQFLSGELSMDKDVYIQRALLNESVTELDVLFREELETTFIMGAQPRKIFRDAANVRNVTKRKGDIPRLSDQIYADVYAQGTTIESGREGFDTVPFECEKIAQAFEVTDELIIESEPDAVEALARKTGAAVENTINRIALVELVDQAGKNVDAQVGGTNDWGAVRALNEAAGAVEIEDLGRPDTAVVHPEFETHIFQDSNVVYANRGGSTEPVQDREFGDVMGLNRFVASDGTYNNATDTRTLSTSNTWGYAADAEKGAVAYVQEMFNLIVWQDMDMETRDYEDPIRDLQGSNVRSYVDATFGQTNAAATVQY